MLEIDNSDDDSGGTVFRDVIMLALAGFVVIVLLLLPHLNPPAEAGKEPIAPPGNLVVEIRWPDDLDVDVDLWVQAPGDTPVGFSNKGGDIFNLLRDDRGHLNDVSNLNYEVSYSRGIPEGEYTVNLHYYTARQELSGPVPVEVIVSLKASDSAPAKQILASKAEVSEVGDEITVFRFDLNENGKLVRDSVRETFKPLRAEKSRSESG